jgi:hypothetical protein
MRLSGGASLSRKALCGWLAPKPLDGNAEESVTATVLWNAASVDAGAEGWPSASGGAGGVSCRAC